MKKRVILTSLVLATTTSFAYSNSVFILGWFVDGNMSNEAHVGDSVSTTVRLIGEPMTRYRVDVLREKVSDDEVVATKEWTYSDLGTSMSIVNFVPQDPGAYYLEVHRREGSDWNRIYVLEEDTFPGRLTVFPPSRWRIEVVDQPPNFCLCEMAGSCPRVQWKTAHSLLQHSSESTRHDICESEWA